jgi:hypothetical protein
MASRAAQLVNIAIGTAPQPVFRSAAQIRRAILGQGEPWVRFSNLIDYSWSLSIPVIQLLSCPSARRPDGFCARIKGRPVIILCKKSASPAWLLCILAHELAHIALGHIDDDGALIDENVKHNVQDEEETAANAFAVELLTGNAENRFHTSGSWPNATPLADAAKPIAKEMRIDPGHIVLNYAHTMGDTFWPVANAALKLLKPKRDALRIVRAKLAEHLDWSSLPEDSCEFLMRVSQAGHASDLPVG